MNYVRNFDSSEASAKILKYILWIVAKNVIMFRT